MTTTDSSGRRRWAALLLAVITPIVAELTLGNPPLSQIWLMLLWVPIYGAGTVLIRELVRRRGAGWLSILLLGIAYGIVEEGLALQAISSPTLYGVAGWAPRILGLNSAYTELNLPYHAVFSVALPILLVDLVFPGLRDRPYLKRTGLVVTGVVFVLGGALLRVSVTSFIDPGYQAPIPVVAGCLAAVALLAVLALRVVPRASYLVPSTSQTARHSSAAGTGAVPGSWSVTAFGGIVAFGYLALLFPFGGATQPAFTRGNWVVVPMLAAAALAVVAWWLVRRWTTSGAWTDRHSLALAGGALVAHTAFGVLANAATLTERAELTALGLVMIGLLALLGRHTPVPGLIRK
ncbi:hypothetical protein [Nonomuraea aurantiaca]|uniref:hypothetical protein n=1 Tax=Nonomuraea aurantiaca TaxID=2878562 RepID=UPI001CD98A8E|nr:hypothetical protein [Nonomuraea aurantiaca]MCA2224959.1 hypothetical protein [Nonomuraea aurantiaca]